MAYKFKTSAKKSRLIRKIKSDKAIPENLLQKVLRKKNKTTVTFGLTDIVVRSILNMTIR